MINKFLPSLNLEALSANEHLTWDRSLIDRFSNRWDWSSLSCNRALPWTADLIEQYVEQWNWADLSGNAALPWSEALIVRFRSEWVGDQLSSNEALPWTESLIERHREIWDWDRLSWNNALPWSGDLLERYLHLWNFDHLSGVTSLPWSDALIDRYADDWNWGALSLNEGIPWTVDLIDRYAELWDWEYLSQNEALPWTEALLKRYADRWYWGGSDPDYSALSGNPALPWTSELIERYMDRWNWDWLEDNSGLPWSEPFIVKHAPIWCWQSVGLKENLWHILFSWNERDISAVMDWPASVLCEEKYAKAKPHFMALAKHFGCGPSRDDVREFMRAAIRALRDQMGMTDEGIANMKPYVVRFVRDVQSGAIRLVDKEAEVEGQRQSDCQVPTNVLREALAATIRVVANGALGFPDYARAMIDEVGDAAVPYLRLCYDMHRHHPGFDNIGMTPPEKMDEAGVTLGLATPVDASTNTDEVNRLELDPEILEAGIGLAAFHIERGVPKFLDIVDLIAEDINVPLHKLEPYLAHWYEGARMCLQHAGFDVSGMDGPAEVRAAAADITQAPAETESRGQSVQDQILDATVKALIEMPYDEPLSGEGSGLETVWDEICAQVQVEPSIYWDTYLATIRAYLEGYLDERSTADKHEIMPDADDDEILDVLLNGLLIRAADYENDSISRFIARRYGGNVSADDPG